MLSQSWQKEKMKQYNIAKPAFGGVCVFINVLLILTFFMETFITHIVIADSLK